VLDVVVEIVESYCVCAVLEVVVVSGVLEVLEAVSSGVSTSATIAFNSVGVVRFSLSPFSSVLNVEMRFDRLLSSEVLNAFMGLIVER